MTVPYQKRMEEHKNRDELYTLTLERFSNYTKDVDSV